MAKVQGKDEKSLTLAEARSIKKYIIEPSLDTNMSNSDDDEDADKGFCEGIWEAAEANKKSRAETYVSKYKHMTHIRPTSNIVERLFSRCKLIMRDQRKSMAPKNLENLLFLRFNNFLWNAALIDKCINDPPAVVA